MARKELKIAFVLMFMSLVLKILILSKTFNSSDFTIIITNTIRKKIFRRFKKIVFT